MAEPLFLGGIREVGNHYRDKRTVLVGVVSGGLGWGGGGGEEGRRLVQKWEGGKDNTNTIFSARKSTSRYQS